MKKNSFIILALLVLILPSCTGEFIKDSTPSVFLVAPEDLCQEGIERPDNQLDIEFLWKKSDNGDFLDYRLEIIDLESGDIIPKMVSGDSLSTRITLDRGRNFSWQVFGIIDGNSEPIPSIEKMEFYSESTPENNLSPLPVIINTRQPTASSVEITWEVSTRETLDNLEFNVFFGPEEDPIEQLEDTKTEPERILKEGLSNGVYYIKIVTTKKVDNVDIYSTSSFKKITVSGN